MATLVACVGAMGTAPAQAKNIAVFAEGQAIGGGVRSDVSFDSEGITSASAGFGYELGARLFMFEAYVNRAHFGFDDFGQEKNLDPRDSGFAGRG